MKRPTQEAYQLLMEGTLMLARMEHNGMKLDMDYLERTIDDVEVAIKEAEAQLKSDRVWKIWKKRFGDRANLGSSDQLATVVYKELGHPCESLTATGKFKADEEALQKIDEPFIKGYFAKKKLEKALTTYLYGFRREQVDGVLHPSFNFNPRSYRSCVAKGTLIEVVRDVRKYPKGIPIENVQTGDLVYCYDQNRELCLRKVLWAGKTGHRKVIRLHWRARGKYGHIDVTPEHKIRLRSGEYVEAQFLDGADFRNSTDKKKSPKIATLAMGRNGHRIYATGKAEQLEHRFVYEQLFGPLGNQVVHHKDGNHWNNAPSNLEAMSNKEHSRYHAPTTLTHEIRLKGVRKRQANHALYGDRFSKGDQSPNWINISRFGFMRLLIQSGCRPTKTNLDYETVIARCKLFGINLKFVADRFDGEGHYITLGRTRLLHAQGLTPMMRSLRVNFYKLRRLLKQRGLSEQRRWGNQFGPCIPHNHAIIRVEQLDTPVDVYDLEVEEHHNFIANEICVHNSCSDPNVQNIPSRGKTLPKLLRDCFIPRRGRRIIELDYCLHPDTLVKTIEGDQKISDIQAGTKVLAYKKGKITWGLVTKSAHIKNLPAYKITFDNNESVIASSDHKWPVRTDAPELRKICRGKFNGKIPSKIINKTTEQLKIGDRMIPCRRIVNKKNGYIHLYADSAHRYTKEHVLIAEAHLGIRPKGMDIHHKDGNKENNQLSNLQYIDKHEHLKTHSLQNWQKLSHTEKQNKVEQLRKGIKNRRSYKGSGNPNYNKKKGEDLSCLFCNKIYYKAPCTKSKYCSRKCYYASRQLGLNHKIVSIEFVGYQPMHAITVEPDNNFVLSCGVVTCNSQLEVRIAACYHKDPNMLKYIRDPSTDMHRDTAMDLFMIPMDQVEKKTTRDWTKNRFVFPVFYGSVFFQCAPNLWKGVESGAKLPNGKTIKDHLAENGITELGEKDSDYKSGRIATRPGTFMDHVRKVEDIFWKERFPVYTEWKQRWWKQYSQEGGYHMLSGFAINGVFKRNDVLNWAIQGSSFHCLLWSAIEIQKYLDKHRMKTKLINEIHDCLIADVPESELQEYLYLARKVMVNRCMKYFPWIIVPLEIEAEVTPEGGTWFSKQVWEDTGSEWRLKQ